MILPCITIVVRFRRKISMVIKSTIQGKSFFPALQQSTTELRREIMVLVSPKQLYEMSVMLRSVRETTMNGPKLLVTPVGSMPLCYLTSVRQNLTTKERTLIRISTAIEVWFISAQGSIPIPPYANPSKLPTRTLAPNISVTRTTDIHTVSRLVPRSK